MQLFVKTPAGQTVAVQVQDTDRISTLSSVAGEASFFCAGQILDKDLTFAQYCISQNTTVETCLALEGGKGKKKKKRVFTKPKKNPHKHKNVPMRVLKYYKVEEDGDTLKVTPLRVTCPHPLCGAGVFMAVHKDRKTCGKCALTYVAKK